MRKLSKFINKSDFIGRCQTNVERPTCFNIKNFTRNHLRVTVDRIISQYFLPETALQNCSNEKVFWKYTANFLEKPMPKFDFNKVTKHRCINLLRILRTPFPKNTSGGLLLFLLSLNLSRWETAWNETKYGVFSGSHFLVFSQNTAKYGREKTPYLDTFHAVGMFNSANPTGNYKFKVSNRNSRTRCEICSKLTIKTAERRHWRCSDVFTVYFEHISHRVLVYLLLTLNM